MLLTLVTSLALGASATYGLGLRTEGRYSPDTEHELQSQINPTLSLNLPFDNRVSLLGSYTPRIILFEPQARHTVSLLHAGRLAAQRRIAKEDRIFIEEQIAYGEDTFSWLVVAAEGGIPSFDRLTELPPFRYFSTTTSVGVEQTLSRRLSYSAIASYLVSGGADATARNTVPLQRGPRLALKLTSSISKNDALLTALDAYATSFGPSVRAYLADASAGWRHDFSSVTRFDALLGAAIAYTTRTNASDTQVYPFVAAGLQRSIPQGAREYLSASLRARLGPAVDPLNGSVYARAESFAHLEFAPVAKIVLAASGGGAVPLSGSLVGERLGFGEVSTAFVPSSIFSLKGGVRAFSVPSVPVPKFQWAVFLAMTLSGGGHF